jgi:hypothetical protein
MVIESWVHAAKVLGTYWLAMIVVLGGIGLLGYAGGVWASTRASHAEHPCARQTDPRRYWLLPGDRRGDLDRDWRDRRMVC